MGSSRKTWLSVQKAVTVFSVILIFFGEDISCIASRDTYGYLDSTKEEVFKSTGFKSRDVGRVMDPKPRLDQKGWSEGHQMYVDEIIEARSQKVPLSEDGVFI